MAPTTTVIDAGKDLPDNHTPTFAKEPKLSPGAGSEKRSRYMRGLSFIACLLLFPATVRFHRRVQK